MPFYINIARSEMPAINERWKQSLSLREGADIICHIDELYGHCQQMQRKEANNEKRQHAA